MNENEHLIGRRHFLRVAGLSGLLIPFLKSRPRSVAPDAAKATFETFAGFEAGLNCGYNFNSFVIGSCNQFAHEAASAVARSPGGTYNPLLLYGAAGLGKTHLMHAIAWQAAPALQGRVIYRSGERLTNEFIEAIRNGALEQFRRRYGHADLLLIGDLQFLSGMKRSQEEFFNMFKTLFDGHKQIVLSVTRHPAEIPGIDQRLLPRFERGLTAELKPPDMATRLAILHKKVDSLEIELKSWIFEFIAERIRLNMRRMEGALMSVAFYSLHSGPDINTKKLEYLLRDILDQEAKEAV
jgi:chromosomal replication initiator protein